MQVKMVATVPERMRVSPCWSAERGPWPRRTEGVLVVELLD
eukprot:CAMPEP_0172193240 /NCGR_PEP_ID=MMETSP1050-20130122/24840_1 /TAXON_ID=233186 /ORGANISM="Cryptomonas curvata, Strain CCAP979/52" /LENGTH=40 /DNA_ID= /DNA_START= /DNA_END= /DNA_ORIENTATION=